MFFRRYCDLNRRGNWSVLRLRGPARPVWQTSPGAGCRAARRLPARGYVTLRDGALHLKRPDALEVPERIHRLRQTIETRLPRIRINPHRGSTAGHEIRGCNAPFLCCVAGPFQRAPLRAGALPKNSHSKLSLRDLFPHRATDAVTVTKDALVSLVAIPPSLPHRRHRIRPATRNLTW
jgi:hypothetical protein